MRFETAPGRSLGTRIAGALAAAAIAAVVLLSTGGPARAATETLTLTPNHGQATDSFTAIYEVSPPPADCGSGAELVNFYWDNEDNWREDNGSIGNSAQMQLTGDHCRASVQITPRASDSDGPHHIRGDRAPYLGPVTVYGTASAWYRIDPPPSSVAADSGSSPSQSHAPPALGVPAKAPIGSGDPLLGAASPDTPAVPGPGFAIGIPAAQTSSAASGSARHPRRDLGANGWRVGVVGGVAAAAVALAIAVMVRGRRWSATRI